MLWYKLCFLVLLCDNVFGWWNFEELFTIPPIKTAAPERVTTNRVVEPITEPLFETTKGEIEETTTSEVVTTTEVTNNTEETTTSEAETTTEVTNNTEETTTSETETTTEVTNNTEETTITEEPPTSTESPNVCNTSLHTKEDLMLIFNYFEDELQIHNNINNSFYFEALSIRDRYLGEIMNFQRLFRNKPMHLKNILEDIRNKRQQLLPFVQDISESLNQYPELTEQFQISYENLVPVIKMFEKQKMICQLTCDEDVFVEREMSLKEEIPYDKKEFYCGSIAEVREVIQSNLTSFSEDQQRVFQNRLDLDDVKYASEVKLLKEKLKDIALKEFGRNMYDILELEDAHIQFAKIIKNVPFGNILSEVKYNIAQMRPKTLDFEDAVQKLAKYCKSCSNNFESRQSGPTQDDPSDTPNFDENSNLLDEVVNAELQVLEQGFDDIYTSIFDILDAVITEAETTNIYIDDIRPTLDEIATETNQELHELDKLKHRIPLDYYQGLINLSEELKDILEKIDTYIINVYQIINQ